MRRHVTSSLYPTGRSAVRLYNVIGDALRDAFVTMGESMTAYPGQKHHDHDGHLMALHVLSFMITA